MKVAYIAGPYRDDRGAWFIRRNIEEAARPAALYWGLGYAVICPHLNTAFLDGVADDEDFLEGDLEIISRCVDVMVMLPGWENSRGARAEHNLAKKLGLEIIGA